MERQKTIEKAFTLTGKGLQTGKAVEITFLPESENSGITFVRRDLKGKPSIRLGEFEELSTDRRSILKKGECAVETTEHVTAALWGAGIDNVRIELDSSEPPGADGSALEFLKALKNSGIKEQSAPREYLEIREPVWAEDKEAFLGVFPASFFKISYILEDPATAIKKQSFSKAVDSGVFEVEIAPARTFCLRKEAEQLLMMGYGRGADLKNTLVLDENGPVGTELRFPDEPVRHKVLDLIGDLYILGKPLKARVIAIRSGHRLNVELLKKIKEVYLCRQ